MGHGRNFLQVMVSLLLDSGHALSHFRCFCILKKDKNCRVMGGGHASPSFPNLFPWEIFLGFARNAVREMVPQTVTRGCDVLLLNESELLRFQNRFSLSKIPPLLPSIISQFEMKTPIVCFIFSFQSFLAKCEDKIVQNSKFIVELYKEKSSRALKSTLDHIGELSILSLCIARYWMFERKTLCA